MYLTIETPTGTPLGDGPLHTLIGWEQQSLLSRIGRFAARIAPLPDATRHELLQPLRIARCHAIIEGQRIEVGAGIIESVTREPDGTFTIAGSDLLRELAYRRLHGLALYNETSHAPTLLLESGGSFTPLANAADGNPATYDEISLAATGDFLYIGLPFTFNRVEFTLSLGNSNPAVAQWGFSDSVGGWREPYVTDGTALAGAPLAQSGNLTFTRPGAWTPRTLNGLTRYWLRLDPAAALTAVRLNELAAIVRTPVPDDIAQLMTYAPPGWSLNLTTGYDGSAAGTEQTFADETLFAALVNIAERAGEHFRAGAGRELLWLRADSPAHPLVVTDANLLTLEQLDDSQSLITRLYPYGAGNGGARVTLSETTLTPPPGYTLDIPANALISDAAESLYGRIEGILVRPDIRPGDGSAAPDLSASNALFAAALAHLRARDGTQRAFRLTVAGASALTLRPGDQFRLLAQGYDEPLVAHDISARLAPDGAHQVELLAAPTALRPAADSDSLAARLARAESYMSHAQGISEHSLR